MTEFLITGKGGQLANAFERHLLRNARDYVALDITDLDITNYKAITSALRHYRPQIIINCAAYNLVDKAEEDYYEAYRVNALGPKFLALAAGDYGCKLVHYSSDYVFDGLKTEGLYVEQDDTAPLNEYGRSKLMGERLIMESISDPLILRLSWVFGEGQQNFIYKLLQWEKERDSLRVACDEFSVPTSTETVVEVTLKAIDEGLTGLYHLVNSGFCSRYEWATFVFHMRGIKKHIHPVPMASFNLPARRPNFSALSNARLSSLLKISIPHWKEGVEEFLRNSF